MDCLFCLRPIRTGNKGKKFCKEGCRTAYHNRSKSLVNEEISKINLALHNNRKILQRILGGKQEEIVSREQLLKKGFEFDYHTHHVISHYKKNEFIFCFNYGYRKVDDDQYKVVKSFK